MELRLHLSRLVILRVEMFCTDKSSFTGMQTLQLINYVFVTCTIHYMCIDPLFLKTIPPKSREIMYLDMPVVQPFDNAI